VGSRHQWVVTFDWFYSWIEALCRQVAVLLVEMVLPGTAQVEHWEEYPHPYATSFQMVIAVPADLIRLENY
jgi:hypothetical protein